MSFELSKIFSEMGVFALVIAGALALMAIAALTVFVERLWVYGRTRRRSARFAGQAAAMLGRGAYQELMLAAEQRKSGSLASLVGAGLRTYSGAVARPPSGDVSAIELARREVARRADFISAQLRRGLGVLASVGSVAPFVGLLGTVVGIIDAFEGIAAEGSGGIGAVSSGIAEALVVTAIGLVVAIPAVLAFNYLSARSDSLMMAIDQARGQLIDHLEAHPIAPPADGVEGAESAEGAADAAGEAAQARAA
jgi:biopolymer transport protein ExbB